MPSDYHSPYEYRQVETPLTDGRQTQDGYSASAAASYSMGQQGQSRHSSRSSLRPIEEEVVVHDDEVWYVSDDDAPADPLAMMPLLLGVVVVVITLLGFLVLRYVAVDGLPVLSSDGASVGTANSSEQLLIPVAAADGELSQVFDPAVLFWEPKILEWAAEYNLDPNAVATVMQIESCGDPRAVSSAGAMGLFQVMPFHFEAGEDSFDPDTNAFRGMRYLNMGLDQFNGDFSLAFAGYNGGHGTVPKGWSQWPNEMQRYYTWANGIYGEVSQGMSTSPTLERWLAAGGAGLCQQAIVRQQALGITFE